MSCRDSRSVFHGLAGGLVWRGGDAGYELIRQALPPRPGVLSRFLDTWKRLPRPRRYGPPSMPIDRNRLIGHRDEALYRRGSAVADGQQTGFAHRAL